MSPKFEVKVKIMAFNLGIYPKMTLLWLTKIVMNTILD